MHRTLGHSVDEEIWAEIAAGIRSGDESLPLLEHATKCDRCGALMRQALAIVRDEPTAEEESLLAGMKSQQRQWAEALAPKLKHAAGPV